MIGNDGQHKQNKHNSRKEQGIISIINKVKKIIIRTLHFLKLQ